MVHLLRAVVSQPAGRRLRVERLQQVERKLPVAFRQQVEHRQREERWRPAELQRQAVRRQLVA